MTRILQEFWGLEEVRALLTSVDRGNMLVLDLDSTDRWREEEEEEEEEGGRDNRREQYTRTESYFGQPFVFNMIHTFGGQVGVCLNRIVDILLSLSLQCLAERTT